MFPAEPPDGTTGHSSFNLQVQMHRAFSTFTVVYN
jgi:hypothetical protein